MSLSLLQRAALFVGAYVAETFAYSALRGTSVERFVIDTLTVQPAAWMLQSFAPDAGAVALGPRLTSPAGGINVLAGCEGTDAAFLIVAALIAAPFGWRNRLLGFAMGVPLVFVANLARLITLFFASRSFPEQFALLHGFAAPLAIVAVVALWFAWFVRHFGNGPVPVYRL